MKLFKRGWWPKQVRIVSIVMASVMCALMTTAVVLAAPMAANVVVTENNTEAHSLVPLWFDSPNEWLRDKGYITATANDTRMRTVSGSDLPWMVADNKTLMAVTVPKNTTNTLKYVLGQSDTVSQSLIFGYGGYITTPDFALGEVGNNGSVEMIGVGLYDSGTIYSKGDFLSSWNATTEQVTTHIGTLNGAALVSSSGWTDHAKTIDGNLTTYAYVTPGANISSVNLITGLTANTNVSALIYYILPGYEPHYVDVDIYTPADASWHNAVTDFEPIYVSTYWCYIALDAPTIIGTYRIRAKRTDAGQIRIYETRALTSYFYELTATGVTAGKKNIVFNIAPTYYELVIDSANTTVAGAITIPDTTDNWTFGNFAYCESIEIYKNGVRTLYYQPSTMIIGTSLPDHEGNSDGTITWGDNPEGISITLAGFASTEVESVSSTELERPRDVIPPVRVTWSSPMDTVSLRDSPLYPIVAALSTTDGSDYSDISEEQIWIFFGLAITILLILAVVIVFPHHAIFIGIACVAGCLGAVLYHRIFPEWTVLVSLGVLAATAVMERSQSI